MLSESAIRINYAGKKVCPVALVTDTYDLEVAPALAPTANLSTSRCIRL